ncbi:hypothetical protein OJAV_G00164140 [Oryzias javanicus]|uniref:Uncharacterized protein n=1 Tax=Oryzias javanicus TaxID=123683 RepID=A0A3S2P3B4_ORYJA|nr:hypothetical protein OJAV_G00164140 [Oryzias javanicus]
MLIDSGILKLFPVWTAGGGAFCPVLLQSDWSTEDLGVCVNVRVFGSGDLSSLLAQLQQLQSFIRRDGQQRSSDQHLLTDHPGVSGSDRHAELQPFSRRPTADEEYRPTGVISRTILTDPSATADDGRHPDTSPPDSSQSGAPEEAGVLQELTGSTDFNEGRSQSLNASVKEEVSRDGSKSAHADEM